MNSIANWKKVQFDTQGQKKKKGLFIGVSFSQSNLYNILTLDLGKNITQKNTVSTQ